MAIKKPGTIHKLQVDIPKYVATVCHNESRYVGYVTIVLKGKDGHMKIVASCKTTELEQCLSKLSISPNVDYYISKGVYTKPGKWDKESLLGYTTIDIDLDGHKADISDEELSRIADALRWYDAIPSPNAIVWSGRGLHVIWTIKQAAHTLSWMYEAVARDLCKKVGELISVIAPGSNLELDLCASITGCGLTRLAGTTSQKTKRPVRLEYIHGTPLDLAKQCENAPGANQRGIRFKHHSNDNDKTIMKKRIEQLQGLAKLRDYDLTGKRELFAYIYYSTCIGAGYDDNTAVNMTLKMNERFGSPLRGKEVTRIACRKPYKLTNARIIDDLAISEDEQRSLGTVASDQTPGTGRSRNRNAKRDAARRDQKRKRDETIIALWEKLQSINKAAKDAGVAYGTVKKVLKSAGKIA